MQHEDDRDFHYATDAQWDRAAAREIGAENPDLAWVLTDRDTWYPNPFYKGPKVPHPEDDSDFGGDDEPDNDDPNAAHNDRLAMGRNDAGEWLGFM